MSIGNGLLIVEDEGVVALDLRTSLESLGYRVLGVCANADDAVRSAEALRPDLVLMDIHLDGDVPGTEAARVIRERFQIPSIFLTAYAEEDMLRNAESSAPYGYLLKPYQLRELNASVRMGLARRRAEREEERQRRRLRMAVEAARLGVWEWSGVEGRMEWEREFPDAFPFASAGGEALGLPGLAEAEAMELSRELEVCQVLQRTVRVGRDGVGRWVELCGRNFAAKGEPARWVGVARDVTEAHLNAASLRQASVVFQASAEGILVLDHLRRIVSANESFYRLTGLSAESALGRDPDECLHVEPHDEGFYRRLEGERRFWQGEVLCRRRNETFPCWQHASVVRDAEGKVSHYVLAISDISAIRAAEAHIHFLAYHDQLTGLGNRHFLQVELEKEIARAKRRNECIALLFIDLDGFKSVNDDWGHEAGDALLVEVAERLRQHVRAEDVVVRLGGDEFLVVAPGLERGDACGVMVRRLLAMLARPVALSVGVCTVSASIGVAFFPDSGGEPADLLHAADRAMYEAKRAGKNEFRLAGNGAAAS
ncbi:diguanylate cyclase domain-containing protein [Chromobacterium aquaticum]|uniref:Diguanylate cyclase domain-containing protein n=1 Tax=Chromobacterium aquaticum TaxID=467180 RepID=A0ABV8ZU91_9NEIS|nr:diguanylate cyclase [Chromobacterium aquaticum]MCD5362206.1 diguanylate cyclase [Chromobacterium aquaticum]